MSQHADPLGPEGPERVYTPEELDEFARRQLDAARHGEEVDPLTDPIQPGQPGAAPAGAPQGSGLGPMPTAPPDGFDLETSTASRARRGGPSAVPPAAAEPPPAAPQQRPAHPPQEPPATPPRGTILNSFAASAPPPSSAQSPQQVPPPLPHQAPREQALPPLARIPAAAPAGASTSESSLVPTEPRRFMSATDFLDRRDSANELGPATWGWRGRVNRWSGGLVKPRMGAAELAFDEDRALIQKDFDGPRTIAFINPKGGAAKTTGVLAAGFTFGTVRGGGVVAWDNNETRGTLGIRGARGAHRNTTRELLEDLERFEDVYQSRIGDLGAFVRSQGDAHFDVLASDERPDVTGQIHAADFNAVHHLLERFYRILLVDTGNNMRAENWLAAAEAADLLVVTSTVREDTGYSGLWMLDALQDAGYADLKHKTVTVLSDPSQKVDNRLAADLVQVYEQRTRAVYRVPFDPALVAGGVVPYHQLSDATRRSWLRACAGMASAL